MEKEVNPRFRSRARTCRYSSQKGVAADLHCLPLNLFTQKARLCPSQVAMQLATDSIPSTTNPLPVVGEVTGCVRMAWLLSNGIQP